MKRIHIFMLATTVSLALMYFAYLPVIGVLGRVLLLFSTLFHEMGHGLMAMLLGGDFKKLEIGWDASGVTTFAGVSSRIGRALVAASGLVGPAIAAAALFWAARGSDGKLKSATRLFGATLLIIGVLTARSFWAVFFTVGLGLLLLIISHRVSRPKLETFVVFIGVQLGLSVFTRADYLFAKSAGPGLASDVAQMSEALFLPYWFWGTVCGLFSVIVLFWGCRCYIDD